MTKTPLASNKISTVHAIDKRQQRIVRIDGFPNIRITGISENCTREELAAMLEGMLKVVKEELRGE